MVASLKASTYLVDGVDLEAAGVELTHDGAGLWSGLSEDIGLSTFPGTDGGLIGGGMFRPYTHSTMYLVRGTGFDNVWTKIVALRRRCKPGQTVTLTRQMPDPEGTAANTNHTTTARRQTDRVSWLSDIAAAIDIDWLIADSPWYASAVAIGSAAGSQSIAGDVPTHRMTLTLAAGAARTITNTTTGHAFTYSATVPASGVLVDVEARTAVDLSTSPAADVSQYLSWTKFYPMRFQPGTNVLTVSAGSASVSYQPAYQ